MSVVTDVLSMPPWLRVPGGDAPVENNGHDVLEGGLLWENDGHDVLGGPVPWENDGHDVQGGGPLPWRIQSDSAATKVRSAGDERFDVSLLEALPDFIHLNHNTESTSDIRDDPDFDVADLPSSAMWLPVGPPAKPPACRTISARVHQKISDVRNVNAFPCSMVASIDDDRPGEPTTAHTKTTKRAQPAEALSAALTIKKPARGTVWTCIAPDCSYSSGRKGNLERHVRSSHTKERPYSCGTCSYTSADAGAVKRHARQHTGEAPAICNFPGCDYKAMDFSNLGRHLRVHTGKRPFKCPHCPYAAAQSGSISCHVNRRHSTVRAFTCSHCSYAAKTLPDLKKHEMRH
jgi:hypothetical protein